MVVGVAVPSLPSSSPSSSDCSCDCCESLPYPDIPSSVSLPLIIVKLVEGLERLDDARVFSAMRARSYMSGIGVTCLIPYTVCDASKRCPISLRDVIRRR